MKSKKFGLGHEEITDVGIDEKSPHNLIRIFSDNDKELPVVNKREVIRMVNISSAY